MYKLITQIHNLQYKINEYVQYTKIKSYGLVDPTKMYCRSEVIQQDTIQIQSPKSQSEVYWALSLVPKRGKTNALSITLSGAIIIEK